MQAYQLFPNAIFAAQTNGKSKNKKFESTDRVTFTISTTGSFKRLFRTLSQTVTISQSSIQHVDDVRYITDNIVITASLSSLLIRPRSSTDTLTLTQFLSNYVIHSSSLSDTLTPTQSLSNYIISFPSLTDTLSFTESLINNIFLNLSLLSSFTLTHTLTSYIIHIQSLTDNITFSDDVITPITYNETLTDTLTFSNDATGSFPRYFATLTDTLVFSDDVSIIYPLYENLILIDTLTTTINRSYSLLDSLSFNNTLTYNFVFSETLDDTITFSDAAANVQSNEQSIIDTLTFTDSLVDQLRHISTLNNNFILTDQLLYVSTYNITLLDNISLNQTLSQQINLHIHYTDTLSLTHSYVTHHIGLVIAEDYDISTAGGSDVKAEPKNCFEVSNQCHAEGLETIAGLSFPCTIIHGQLAIISGYNGNDFFEKCNIGLYNLSGGHDRLTEMVTNANTISLTNNDADTLITFPHVITDHTNGFISLLDDFAAHSEGSSTIASGKYSHAGGYGAIAELPSKFARSDNSESQFSIISLSGLTLDDTLTPLKINGNHDFLIRTDHTYSFFIQLAARNMDGSEHASFLRRGIIHNESNVLEFVGSIATIGTDINALDWGISVTADTSLKISVTGETGKMIKWFARIDCLEL